MAKKRRHQPPFRNGKKIIDNNFSRHDSYNLALDWLALNEEGGILVTDLNGEKIVIPQENDAVKNAYTELKENISFRNEIKKEYYARQDAAILQAKIKHKENL